MKSEFLIGQIDLIDISIDFGDDWRNYDCLNTKVIIISNIFMLKVVQCYNN